MKVKAKINKIKISAKKHKPEIMIVAGVIGVGVAIVSACKATIKACDILDDAKEERDDIKAAKEAGDLDEDTAKKELTKSYVRCVKDLTLTYLPSAAITTMSLMCIISSNRELKRRNIALGMAYSALGKSYEAYRERVAEKVGAEEEKRLYYNIQEHEVEEIVTDEDGNTSVVTKKKYSADTSDGHSIFWDEVMIDEQGNEYQNHEWDSTYSYRKFRIDGVNDMLNTKLRSAGMIYLNEAFEYLGIHRTKVGQVDGWVYDPEKGNNQIKIECPNIEGICRDEDPMLLTFNCQRNILGINEYDKFVKKA